jgi:hypothetical protein
MLYRVVKNVRDCKWCSRRLWMYRIANHVLCLLLCSLLSKCHTIPRYNDKCNLTSAYKQSTALTASIFTRHKCTTALRAKQYTEFRVSPKYPMYDTILKPSWSVWLPVSRFSQLLLCGNTRTEVTGNATNGLVAETRSQMDWRVATTCYHGTCLWVQGCHAIKLQCSGKH